MHHFLKLTGCLSLCFLSLVSFAQSTPGLINHAVAEVGQDLTTNTAIQGIEYAFPNHLYRYKANLLNNQLMVSLRESNKNDKYWKPSGTLFAYNPSTEQTKWSHKVNFNKVGHYFNDDIVIERDGLKSSRLDPETGNKLWTSKGTLLDLPNPQLALTFSFSGNSSTINGIDLATGKTLWQRKLLQPYVEGLQKLNDSTLMVFSSGLYIINLNDEGKGWDIRRVMSATKTDFNKVGGAFVLGLISGALTGFSYIPNPSSVYSDISSNVLQENNEFYFATANKLERYKINGTYLWSKPVNEKTASRSHLFKVGDKLCQINFGHAINYGIPKRYGKPFLATYDTETGEQLAIKMLENDKDFIVSHSIQNDKIYLLYKNALEMHELVGDEFILRQKTTMANQTKMYSFASKKLYIKNDTTYYALTNDSPTNFVVTEENELLELDDDFLVKRKISQDSLYLLYLDTPLYQFIGNSDSTIVLEKRTNTPIATLKASRNAQQVGTRLYSSDKDKLREIDISRFLKEND